MVDGVARRADARSRAATRGREDLGARQRRRSRGAARASSSPASAADGAAGRRSRRARRRRARRRTRLGGQAREPQQHGARHGRAGPISRTTPALARVGRTPSASSAFSSCAAAAGCRPSPRGRRRRTRVGARRRAARARARATALGAERRRAARHASSGSCGDLGQQRRVGARLGRCAAWRATSTGRPSSRRDEVGEEAQRRAVAPVQVVDREHQRPLGGEVDGQPVQAVERGERASPPAVAVRPGCAEDGARAARRRRRAAGSRVAGSDERRLEQLAHDAERELALELAPRARQHAQPPPRAAAPHSASSRVLPIPAGPSTRTSGPARAPPIEQGSSESSSRSRSSRSSARPGCDTALILWTGPLASGTTGIDEGAAVRSAVQHPLAENVT